MAEERVKIAEIDIGVDKLVSKTGEVKKKLEELRKANRELKKDTDGLSNATGEQLKQFTLAEVEIKNLSKEYNNSRKVLDAYINIQNQDIRTKEQAREANLKLIAIANRLDTTNKDHEDALKKINDEIDKNTDFIKKNASEYEKTKINVGNYKESIKAAYQELGIFGKYQADVNNITSAGGPIINFVSTNLKQVKEDYKKATAETYGMSKAQIAAHLTSTTLSAGLKVLRIALAATGIGLVVIALGSLVAYLATTQAGIDKLNRVLTPLKEVMGTLLGVVQDFGKEIFEAFSNPKQLIKDVGESIKQNLINRFTALGKIIKSVMNGDWDGLKDGVLQATTGVEDLTGKLDKMGEKISDKFGEAWERGKQIEKIQQNLNKTEAAYIKQQAQLRKEFEQQKKLAEDVNKPIAEREAAAAKAIEAQEEISKGTIERIKQEAQLLKLKQMANDTSDAEKAELARKLAEIDKALEEEAAKTTEAQNKLNSIRKEGAAKQAEQAREAVERNLTAQKEELDLFLAKQGIKAKTLQEELKVAEDVSKKKLEILEAEFRAGKISKTAYETEKLNITQEYAQKQAEVAVANAERELEAFKSIHQSKLDANEFLTEELFNQEQHRLERIAEKEKEFHKRRLEQGVINRQEYNDAIALVDEETYQEQKALTEERAAAKKEQEAFELALKRENEMADFENRFELEREREQRRYEAELEEAQRLNADITEIEKKHARVRQDITEAEENAKLDMSKETFGGIAKLIGEKTAMGKAAGVAEAFMNTYQGVTQVWKNESILPEPFATAQKVISTGVVLKSGLEAVKKITATKVPKAARGIVLDINGKSHAQGGETFYDADGNPIVEAQGGEKMVILKREASRELDTLSALNQKHGGVSLKTPVSYANNGGAVSLRGNSVTIPKNAGIDYDRLSGLLSDAVAAKVNSVKMGIPVNDINELNHKNAVVQSGADL